MKLESATIIQGSVSLLALSVLLLSACGGSSGGGGGATADTTPPTITAVTPLNAASGVSVKTSITATFSETLNASSVSAASFTLTDGASSVPGTVSYSGNTATFTPAIELAHATPYTATVASGVTDTAGNALAGNYSWAFTVKTQPLNDTGITYSQCYQAASDVMVACNSAAAIALNPEQDGMVGRDANAATNLNNDGKLGFSFTDVAVGSDHCVQDNVTGLMWEVKTNDGGLRDWTKTYTNLGDNSAGDASTFVTAVNSAGMCGFKDWRLPTADELTGIVDYGVVTPSIDANWFPNTQSDYYWSASSDVGNPASAWIVSFDYGYVFYSLRGTTYRVRLVRTGQ